MNSNKYNLAGWVAIGQTAMFPLVFGVGIIQSIIARKAFDYSGPSVGPSDLLAIALLAMSIYTIYMLRELLHDHFDYHGIDTLVTLAIWWIVISQLGGIGLKVLMMIIWPMSALGFLILWGSWMAFAMITIGVIDIMIGIKLTRQGNVFGDKIKAYAYVTLIAGVLEVTVIGTFLALILVPISSIILAMIFFQQKEEVEFV